MDSTRVVVGGRATDSDGRTESSCRTISLDPFTIAALRQYVKMIDNDRDAFGAAFPSHGKLMCFEDGRQLHPDTVTRRFNRLVDQAGARTSATVRACCGTFPLYPPRPLPHLRHGAQAPRQCCTAHGPTPVTRSTLMWVMYPGGGLSIGGKRTSGPR